MPFPLVQKTTVIELENNARYIAKLKNFQFKGFIGSGAFKQCFLVVDQFGHSLALKLLKSGCSQDRLDREIDAMSQCNHTNIAKLHEVSSIDIDGVRQEMMIEEFLDGGSLHDYLIKHRQITSVVCADIGKKLSAALAHMCQQRIVHRDIKPANIMFRGELDSPVFVDFGLVRNLGDTSLTQTWLHRGPGTPIFAPPEQLNNEKEFIDWRSDQFSLGVSLSVAVFGKHPFHLPGDTDAAVVERVACKQTLPAEFIEKAKAANLSVLSTMMTPWPVNRFRTPQSLQSAWSLAG